MDEIIGDVVNNQIIRVFNIVKKHDITLSYVIKLLKNITINDNIFIIGITIKFFKKILQMINKT